MERLPCGLVYFPAHEVSTVCKAEHDDHAEGALDDLRDLCGKDVLAAFLHGDEVMCADGDVVRIRHIVCDSERDAPVGCLDMRRVEAAGGGDVLAPCEACTRTCAGTAKELVPIHRGRELSAVDGCDLLRDAECLVAVMRDEDCRDVLPHEDLAQRCLDLPLEVGVERGERLVEEQDICAAREDARKGNTLLLTS